MEISINMEIDRQGQVDLFLIAPIHENLVEYFRQFEYGLGIFELAIILVCRPSYLNLKKRKRFDKKARILYLDVILDFEYTSHFTDKKKLKQYLHERLRDSVKDVVSYKKKVNDFDFESFEETWKRFFWEFVWW